MQQESGGRRLADHADTAMLLMDAYGIDPTPGNYRLWFTYASGTNKKLIQTIDILLSNKRDINNAVCEDLYYRFFQSMDEAEQMASVTSVIEQKLERLATSLAEAGMDTSYFGNTLYNASSVLEENPQVEENLRSIINVLITATKQMEQRNKNLENYLHRSSEQMVELQSNLEAIRTDSITDKLTGIGNRRAFDNMFRQNAIDSMELGNDLCLLLLDIDHFKLFNDTHGHSIGDQVIRMVASTLNQTVGEKGYCARFGGEEFTVLLPDHNMAQATIIANDILKVISQREIAKRTGGEIIRGVTVSIGVAQFHLGEPIALLLERADAGLYAAKQTGRNRVVCENELLQMQQEYKTASLFTI